LFIAFFKSISKNVQPTLFDCKVDDINVFSTDGGIGHVEIIHYVFRGEWTDHLLVFGELTEDRAYQQQLLFSMFEFLFAWMKLVLLHICFRGVQGGGVP
jgi:hypothetical protein